MDIKSAFINGYITEEVYVEQSLGFKKAEFSNHVTEKCGLKQAPRAW